MATRVACCLVIHDQAAMQAVSTPIINVAFIRAARRQQNVDSTVRKYN
jgi:hypothetical protein